MRFVYTILMSVVWGLLHIIALFNKKIHLFVSGRKQSFNLLEQKISPGDKTIWFHVASLGEYEQGLPLMQAIKAQYPFHKLVLTFFSPSGYEVRKHNNIADLTIYLPWENVGTTGKFLQKVNPDFVVFVKYEFWMDYLLELKSRAIPTYLVSGIFRENQVFFKGYGTLYRSILKAFSHFFVQNANSKNLLQSIGFNNVTVSGDTRFDRVVEILDRDNSLDFMADFKQDKTLLVCGSTWPADEQLLMDYLNSTPLDFKVVIAPHNIKQGAIDQLVARIEKKVVKYSDRAIADLKQAQILVLDTIGILTKVYSYADMAYVGGGFGNPGVHNVLEPAVFGVPIVIGPNYAHFAEAIELVQLKGITSIANVSELKGVLDDWIQNTYQRQAQGKICRDFVMENKGATPTILSYFQEQLSGKF